MKLLSIPQAKRALPPQGSCTGHPSRLHSPFRLAKPGACSPSKPCSKLFLRCLTCPMYTYGYTVLWRYAADTCICSMQPVWLSSVGARVQFNRQLSETTLPLLCTWARAHMGYSVPVLGKGTGPGPSYRLVPTLWLGAMSMVSVTAS